MDAAIATATHCHVAARQVVGATTPIPGDGLFKYVTHVTEWCACGARCAAPQYLNAEGLTSFGEGIWTGGLPGV